MFMFSLRKRNIPKTRFVVATLFAMIPTQSRLSANETTPHLRKDQLQGNESKTAYIPAYKSV